MVNRLLLAPCLAILLLADCGAPLASENAPSLLPGSARNAPLSGRSWIAPEAKGQDLIYLSDVQTNEVYVYSLLGRLLGTLSSFGQPRSECSDAAGNVWIADVGGYDVEEYPHGSSTPLVALSTAGPPQGCSVSPVTGDLAVTTNANGAILSIFHHSVHGKWRDPKTYGDSAIHSALFCGYDAQGNLFVDGLDKTKAFRLAELARGATMLTNISVSQPIKTPGQVQWDGTYVAIGDSGVTPSQIYQFSISGSTANEVASTTLNGSSSIRQSWIRGLRVIGPDFNKDVGVWNYPAGGSPIRLLGHVQGYGATVSLAKQSEAR